MMTLNQEKIAGIKQRLDLSRRQTAQEAFYSPIDPDWDDVEVLLSEVESLNSIATDLWHDMEFYADESMYESTRIECDKGERARKVIEKWRTK